MIGVIDSCGHPSVGEMKIKVGTLDEAEGWRPLISIFLPSVWLVKPLCRNFIYMPLHKQPFYYILCRMTIFRPPEEIWVFTAKSAFMQRIADYATTGHHWYIKLTVPRVKAYDFYLKMIVHLPIYNDRSKAFRARKDGKPTGRIFFWEPKDADHFHVVLLLQGKEDELKALARKVGEKLYNIRDTKNILNLTHYELVQEQKTDDKGQKMVWTWRYEKSKYEELRDLIVFSLRSKHDYDVKVLIRTISSTIGFSGSRKQVKAIYELYAAEWQRHRAKDHMPPLPKLVYWVRRKGDAASGHYLSKKDLLKPFIRPEPRWDDVTDAAQLTKALEALKNRDNR